MERTIIDPSWIELQPGLYLEEQTVMLAGVLRVVRTLHSSDGYCIKDMNDIVEDESERIYYQIMHLAIQQSSWTYEQLNAVYISVPVEEGMIIANIPTTDEETH